jgi:hypothetical protein
MKTAKCISPATSTMQTNTVKRKKYNSLIPRKYKELRMRTPLKDARGISAALSKYSK